MGNLLLLVCSILVAGCGGSGGDPPVATATTAPGGTPTVPPGLAPPNLSFLVLDRVEFEPNVLDSMGIMEPDPVGVVRQREHALIWGVAGSSVDTDAFTVNVRSATEIVLTLYLLSNDDLPEGSPVFDELRSLDLIAYDARDGRFDHSDDTSLFEVGSTRAFVGAAAQLQLAIVGEPTLAIGLASVGAAATENGPYLLIIEGR